MMKYGRQWMTLLHLLKQHLTAYVIHIAMGGFQVVDINRIQSNFSQIMLAIIIFYNFLMSDNIVPCNSSYSSLVIAPQSSNECHFCSWSIHSDRMLTLRPGDETNVVELVALCIGEVVGDLLVEGCDGEPCNAEMLSVVGGDWKNRFLGG